MNALFVLAANVVELVDGFSASASRHRSVAQHQAVTAVVPLLTLVEARVVMLRDGQQVDIAPLLLQALEYKFKMV